MARPSQLDAPRSALLTGLEVVAAIEANCARTFAASSGAASASAAMDATLVERHAYQHLTWANYDAAFIAVAVAAELDLEAWSEPDAVRSQMTPRDISTVLVLLGQRIPRTAAGTRFLRDLAENIALASFIGPSLVSSWDPGSAERLLSSVIDAPLAVPIPPTFDPELGDEAPELTPPAAIDVEPIVATIRSVSGPLNIEPSPRPGDRDRVNAAAEFLIRAHQVP
jgi:hypothetical protein